MLVIFGGGYPCLNVLSTKRSTCLNVSFLWWWGLTSKTSGIPRGYRLVSTYDLPGCKTILKFEIWSFSDFFFGGGGYSETLGFGLCDNFHLGGYSETLRFGLCDNFHWGGILKLSDLDCDNFHWGGGILKLSDLDSLTIFIFWGVFWTSE